MDSQPIPESQPSTTLSPFLALPLEMKQQILSNFSDDASDSGSASDPENAITLMILRRTHSSFCQIIPNPWNKSLPDYEHLLTTERQHPYLFPWECRCSGHACRHSDLCTNPFFFFYPCYRCLKLLRRYDNFCNYQMAHLRLRHEGNHGGEGLSEVMGGERVEDRLCDDCWMEILTDFKDHGSYPDYWDRPAFKF